ncbi:hypothetical protein [Citrobacter sp. BIDMC108]|uniref:hypothetical protein n=1 Tax=Citrobacter sp. BIDMC108 TaxID=1686385 RepID=UPI0006508969|nr:hypothetical protein [Citrobacter sp. BIDMC108]
MRGFKGTPGPWFWDEEGLGNKNHIVFGKEYPIEMTSKENKSLIAAAPELLEALQDFMAEPSCKPKSCGHELWCSCRFDKARAAIDKALGK